MVLQRDIVLASASPSRAHLLDSAELRFRRVPSDFDEDAFVDGWGPLTLGESLLHCDSNCVDQFACARCDDHTHDDTRGVSGGSGPTRTHLHGGHPV